MIPVMVQKPNITTVVNTIPGARILVVRDGLSWITGIAALGLNTGYLPPILLLLDLVLFPDLLF
jgi:hypothetical protein